MWEPYIQATQTRLPAGAERIIFDRFHIMREMTKAVDTVRKQEHRAFLREDGESPLTKTKYLWLFGEERVPERHADAFAAGKRSTNHILTPKWIVERRVGR